jgi:predicted enzyme related to lactoylglutathione lyase
MSSLVIFAVNVKALADFYEAVLGLVRDPKSAEGDIILTGETGSLFIHAIPAQIAEGIVIDTPPEPREDTAMKPVFDVKSLPIALEQVENLGGLVTERFFSWDGLTYHDVVDPEGNVVQLRWSP